MQLKHKNIIYFVLFSFVANAQTLTNNKDEIPTTINFIYSYYEQDGIHSPVTGGIGDEELYDHTQKISINIPLNTKSSLLLSTGLDVYTSASTDNINNEHDLLVETSASYKDSRKYTDIGLQLTGKENTVLSINSGFSKEWDVYSENVGLSLGAFSKNQNTKLKLTAAYYKDEWEMIYPLELRPILITNEQDSYKTRNVYDFSCTISQVINKRLKIALALQTVYQKGLLSTPFHRVYFSDTTHTIEKLPNNRLKTPVGLHGSYYINDWSIFKTFYRFYKDDFGIIAHTIEIETPIKTPSFIVLTPFYRIHTQTSAKYFKPFAEHNINTEYYTSDYDLSGMTTHKIGLGFKYTPLFGMFNKQSFKRNTKKLRFKKIEIRTAKYFRINNTKTTLKAYIATIGITYLIY